MTDLGLNFFPSAINDNGVILGGDQIYRGGTLQNLNNLIPAGSGFTIDNATAINDKGQIVAEAGGHTLLLTPTDHLHPAARAAADGATTGQARRASLPGAVLWRRCSR